MEGSRSIVVPIDFDLKDDERAVITDATANAIAHGAALAGRGTLHLVHATPHIGAWSRYGGLQGAWLPLGAATEIDRSARDHATAALRKIASSACPAANVELHVGPGKAAHMILNVAARLPADAIVLASRGHGPLRRALGATVNHVVRGAKCPVLVIPPQREGAG